MRSSALSLFIAGVTALACAGPDSTDSSTDDTQDTTRPDDPELDISGGSSTGGARDANAIPESVVSNSGIGGTTERGQSFVVGRTGSLTGVSIWIKRFSEGQDLTVDVRPTEVFDTDEGLAPVEDNGAALATKVVTWGQIDDEVDYLDVAFEVPIDVTVGQTLAITARAAETDDFHYGWMGGDDLYAGGANCERATDNHEWGCGAYDFGFSVWIADP